MPQVEIYGNRDGERAYSAWHRVKSLRRFMSDEDAYRCAMINMDQPLWIECHNKSFEPFALIETAQDVGQQFKMVKALCNVARRASLPAYTVLYELRDSNTIDPFTGYREIVQFRTKPVYLPDWHPDRADFEEREFRPLTPEQFAEGLVLIRKVGVEMVKAEKLRDFNGQKRCRDIGRLVNKINWVDKQDSFW